MTAPTRNNALPMGLQARSGGEGVVLSNRSGRGRL